MCGRDAAVADAGDALVSTILRLQEEECGSPIYDKCPKCKAAASDKNCRTWQRLVDDHYTANPTGLFIRYSTAGRLESAAYLPYIPSR
jgi:hypothetical protein